MATELTTPGVQQGAADVAPKHRVGVKHYLVTCESEKRDEQRPKKYLGDVFTVRLRFFVDQAARQQFFSDITLEQDPMHVGEDVDIVKAFHQAFVPFLVELGFAQAADIPITESHVGTVKLGADKLARASFGANGSARCVVKTHPSSSYKAVLLMLAAYYASVYPIAIEFPFD